jgi:TnpA family transposase
MITPTGHSGDWTIFPEERRFLANRSEHGRFGLALLLKFFLSKGRFPDHPGEVSQRAITAISEQLKLPIETWLSLDWDGRTIKRMRAEIREWCGFREVTLLDLEGIKHWLIEVAIPHEHRVERLYESFLEYCQQLRVEPPATGHGRRLILSALQEHDTRFYASIFSTLDETVVSKMESLLQPCSVDDGESEWTPWQGIKADPGKAGVASVKEAASRLALVRGIGIPAKLFKDVPEKLIERYAKQAAVEEPFELRRHAGPMRATLQASFLHHRREVLTDHLVDLLVECVHKMTKRADTRIGAALSETLQKAPGKLLRLYKIAKASLADRKKMVEDVIFPVASEDWLLELVQEVESKKSFKENVRKALHRAYSSHYRQMLPNLLNSLVFHTTTQHQPIMQALDVVKAYLKRKGTTYPKGIQVPLSGIVPSEWVPHVMEGAGETTKVTRTAYEICVLKTLREKLRCREIWVVGSRRYRNPEEDLPQDFEERKAFYYAELGIPTDGKAYVRSIREEMRQALESFNSTLPSNPKVKAVVQKGHHRFCVSPFEALPEPENLVFLRREVNQRWWGTSLLDVLKETDLRVNFTQHFRSGTERTHLDKVTLQRRLLLTLFGMGTNTGIKTMESRPIDDYKELLYVRRRFISIDGLRQAIATVVNATLDVRLHNIWGEATTACASDSKQFGAWDQNLLTEWHVRYNGPGVMVYWHVEKNALCIYSQFKRVSSSEVGAMINGVLRHCTEMAVNRQYVDTHGQNTVAFAFCRMLGFQLMPRLKGINRQKLNRAGTDQVFQNLKDLMTKEINWGLIEEHFDTLVKHVVALKLHMTDAESLLRRFTKNNAQHPAYKAFSELGKAIKTIFLCRYLASEDLRREINTGLNVVESWNNTNGFIFYGNAGELATNRQEDQEAGLLALHLIQASLVYINTLMIQRVLTEKEWIDRMKPRDLAGLSPLLTLHINKFGHFELDLETRLPIGA